jgi:hypothetical protein
MDVPLRLVPSESSGGVFAFAEIMSFPGAKMSTQAPKLEKDALASISSVAPTVIAPVAEDGESKQASAPEFPAATTMTTPAATALLTAVLMDSITVPALRLRFATAPLLRCLCCPTSQSIPARTEAALPDPEPSKTLTAIKLAFLAIPYSVPPTVPGKAKGEGEISECNE